MNGWTTFARGAAGFSVATGVFLLVSCASREAESSRSVVRYSSWDLHAVHSQDLLPVMHELTRLAVVESSNSVASVQGSVSHRREAKRLLADIARTAEDIPDHLKTVQLPLEQEALFRHLAGELRAEAKTFRDDVRSLPLAEIKPRFEKLQARCEACHRKFRLQPIPVSRGIPFD